MQVIKIKDEYIKLGQLIKLAGFVDSGVEAKYAIQNSLVYVNGQIDTRRGKKIIPGDIVSFKNEEIRVEIDEN